MAKVIMTCGKICSGKTTYAKRLCREINAVILSCDEVTLGLFDGELGDRHDEISERIQRFLFGKSVEIVSAGTNVILDWGFWKKQQREYAKKFYRAHMINFEFHYVDTGEERRIANVAKRNAEVMEGSVSAYFVDEGLFAKCESLFEAPESDETDIMYIS